MGTEIYDLESLSNVFTYTGYEVKSKTWYQYVICRWRNDINELYDHLMNDKMIMVGFNNEDYDYPLLHHIINHIEEYKNEDGQYIAERIHAKSQYLIDNQFTAINDRNKYIRQLDLYRIWHYNNPARATS